MKRIKLPLSRIVGGLSKKQDKMVLVLDQEPDEALTPSMFIVIPEQEVEVEIDEKIGRSLEAATREYVGFVGEKVRG